MAPPPTLAAWRRVERGRALADLASEPVVVSPTDPCETVDVGFRTRWTASSVLVTPREAGGPFGMVARKDFLTTMTGRYGFGRSLWARRPVADVARWDVPWVPVSASLTDAAGRLAQGDGYSDMIVLGPGGEPVGVLDPTTLMEALAAELAHEASHDHLTGVPSRAWFVDGLRELCGRARRDDGAVVLAFVDLDRLKEVNDSLGHAAGDALLHSVAARLEAAALPGDVVGRLGGDEFALARLLGPQTTAVPWRAAALALGETLRAAIAVSDPGLPAAAHSRASVGLAVGAGPLVDSDRLLREADLAMYGAKKAGGDRVRLAGADLGAAAGRLPDQGRDAARPRDGRATPTTTAETGHASSGPRSPGLVWAGSASAGLASAGLGSAGLASAGLAGPGFAEAGLASAGLAGPGVAEAGLACAGLEVHYQPIARTADGTVREVEALLRCRDDDGELGGPARPLARAAATGRALDLDLWVLAEACRDLAGWRAALGDRAPETVNVNLSPAALDDLGLAGRVLGVLAGTATPARSVRLELSEAATDAQLVRAQPALSALRTAGVPIALDDVGGAIGALRQVTRLPVDAVKIDREVVAHMLDDPVDALIVELVHRLATDLGVPVVAEGVETAEQVEALRAAGVPLMQGFHVARPMPPDDLVTFLAG